MSFPLYQIRTRQAVNSKDIQLQYTANQCHRYGIYTCTLHAARIISGWLTKSQSTCAITAQFHSFSLPRPFISLPTWSTCLKSCLDNFTAVSGNSLPHIHRYLFTLYVIILAACFELEQLCFSLRTWYVCVLKGAFI